MAAKFFLDANVFIESQKGPFRFSYCSAFWDAITAGHEDGMLFSIDRVNKELENPKLRKWVDVNLPKEFFLETLSNEDITTEYSKILTWVKGHHYKTHAVMHFAKGADGWLIASAVVLGGSIVSFEKGNPRRKNKVLIPDVADRFGIRTMTAYEMLEKIGAKFVLRGPK